MVSVHHVAVREMSSTVLMHRTHMQITALQKIQCNVYFLIRDWEEKKWGIKEGERMGRRRARNAGGKQNTDMDANKQKQNKP